MPMISKRSSQSWPICSIYTEAASAKYCSCLVETKASGGPKERFVRVFTSIKTKTWFSMAIISTSARL